MPPFASRLVIISLLLAVSISIQFFHLNLTEMENAIDFIQNSDLSAIDACMSQVFQLID